MIRYHDQMKGAGRDRSIASWTQIGLSGRVGLDRRDGDVVHPQATIAQTITAIVAANAMTTMAMSNAVLDCGRNGLNPMEATVKARVFKSECIRDPVERDEPFTERNGDQIDTPDADLV